MATASQTTAQTGSQPAADRWVDPAALMRIKNLELRAKVIVEGMFSGLHRSPFHGFSVEFSEYRQYTQGDDPRYIDWKLFARSDRHFIKRFEDETNLRCYLLVDRSPSMEYGSPSPKQGSRRGSRAKEAATGEPIVSKSDYAVTLAATMAYFLIQQRDAVGVLTFADQVIGHLPPRYRPGHFHRLLTELERSSTAKETNIEAPLEQIAQLTRKRGMVVLLSDLLVPLGELQKRLSFLRTIGHDVLVIRVLDRGELDLQLDKPSLVRDAETGKKLYIDPDQARQVYRDRFNEHAEALRQTCRQGGVELLELITDQPLEAALFEFLHARGRMATQAVQRNSSWQGRRG